jgi:hypothetical protein
MNDTDKLKEEIAELSRQTRRDEIVSRVIAYILGILTVLYFVVLICSLVWV